MHLSLYTDFSLRLLVYLAGVTDGKPVSARHIAEKYRVSTHHMHKVAQGLRRLGCVESVGGRHGGLKLAKPPAALNIGDIIEAIEGRGSLVDCRRGPCPLHGGCTLKGVLDAAENAFIRELKKYTVADAIRGQTLLRLQDLMLAA